MKRHLKTHPTATTPPRPVQTPPCWHSLPPERQQALISALAAMMVKLLPERRQQREGDDA